MMKCAEVREMLPAYRDESDVSLSLRRHVTRCAECRNELGKYDEVAAHLARLRSQVIDPPPGLKRSLVAIPSGNGRLRDAATHVVRNRRVYAGGLTVAVVGAGAVLWRSRKQRLVPA